MQTYFLVREHGRNIKINFSEIIYIEACGNYQKLVTTSGKSHLILITMKRVEELLSSHLFVRIHKSYIVSLEHVKAFGRNKVYLKDSELPVGNQFRDEVEKSPLTALKKVVNMALGETVQMN